MNRRPTRLLTIALSAVLLVALAAPAMAHVTANPNAAAAGGYHMAKFRVSHGCDGSPTTALRIAIPDGVVSVRPEVVPGWEIETVIGDLAEPFDNHGQVITEGVREIVYSGGSLPDEHFQEFGVSMRMPEGEEGDVVYFPVIQECEEGETAWINIPETFDAWGDTDDPAPYITLTAAGGGHGSDDEEEADDTADAPAAGETELASATEQGGGTDAFAVVALVAGLAGLGLGGAAFATARRSRSGA